MSPDERQALEESFPLFLCAVMECLGYTPDPIQLRIAEWLQNADDRRMLSTQRNLGKTLIISIYILWILFKDPDKTFLIQSATQNHATKIVGFVKQLIELSPVLAEMRPNQYTLWGRIRLDVGNRTKPDKDPSLAAYGIGTMVTGSHVDHIIADDCESPENSKTVEARDKIKEKFEEYENIVNPGGSVTIIGTFQSIESVYVDIIRDWGYDGIRVPSEYPDPDLDTECVGQMWCLAGWLVDDLERGKAKPGQATYPQRWPIEKLLEAKSKSPSTYALQRLLDPTQSDATKYPLKLADLIVHEVDAEMAPARVMWANQRLLDHVESPGIGRDRFYEPGWVSDDYGVYEQSVMWVDPAGRGKDEVGFAVAKLRNGMIHVPVATGVDGGYDTATLRKIAETAERWKVQRILVEPDWSDGLYTTVLRGMVSQTLGLNIAVEDAPRATSRGQKEQWICDVLEPVISAHRVVVGPDVARDTDTMYQLTHITRERGCLRHDDRVEALAGAVSVFTDSMVLDLDKLERDQRDAEMDKEIAEWDRKVHGRSMRTKPGLLSAPPRTRKKKRGWL